MGQKVLSLITEEFELCPKLNGLMPEDQECLSYKVGECRGACEKVESSEDYNKRVDQFLEKINLKSRDFLFISKVCLIASPLCKI